MKTRRAAAGFAPLNILSPFTLGAHELRQLASTKENALTENQSGRLSIQPCLAHYTPFGVMHARNGLLLTAYQSPSLHAAFHQ